MKLMAPPVLLKLISKITHNYFDTKYKTNKNL